METLHVSVVEKEQIWAWTGEGQSVRMVARRLGREQASVGGCLAGDRRGGAACAEQGS